MPPMSRIGFDSSTKTPTDMMPTLAHAKRLVCKYFFFLEKVCIFKLIALVNIFCFYFQFCKIKAAAPEI